MTLSEGITREEIGPERWYDVFAAALRGERATMHGLDGGPRILPVHSWGRRADASDRALLEHCGDMTLDVGCGPGRMTEHLAERGHRALAIDVSPEAVRQARARGVAAVECDVFDAVPGEGHWASVLVADGNIGIGGDPVALLRRVRSVLAPRGRAVVDLASAGEGLRSAPVRIECNGRFSAVFRWAVLGPERIGEVAQEAGFVRARVHSHEERWFAVLTAG